VIPSKFLTRDYRVSSLRSSRKEPTSYLHETDHAYYDTYDREFIIENKRKETIEEENIETDAKVIEYREHPDIEVNDINNSILDSLNQEVQVAECESYANEVYSEEMFILDRHVDAFTGAPNEENVRPLIPMN